MYFKTFFLLEVTMAEQWVKNR